jgi:hypothetical protein
MYKVIPAESTRKEPRAKFWPTFTMAGDIGIAGGTIVSVAIAISVAMGVARLAGFAVGVADAQAVAISATMRKAENVILFFIRILLETALRHFQCLMNRKNLCYITINILI